MTNRFASRLACFAGALALAAMCVGATSVSTAAVASVPSMVLFFDLESAKLTSNAKMIVLIAVDAAKRARANEISIVAYAAPNEALRDPALAAERAAAVKQQIIVFGFRGRVIIHKEAPGVVASGVGQEVVLRRATLHFGSSLIISAANQ